MSLKYNLNNCYLICHQSYINQQYTENVLQNNPILLKSNNRTKSFAMKSVLFDINVPFKRNNQISMETTTNCGRNNKKRKRKRNLHESDYPELSDLIQSLETITENFIKNCHECYHIPKSKKSNENLNTNNDSAQMFVQNAFKNHTQMSTVKGQNDTDNGIITEITGERFLIPPKCSFFNENISNVSRCVNDLYDLIIMDPPWMNKYIKRARHAISESSYHSLDNDIILDIPIESLTKPNSIVVIWCTNSPAHIDCIKRKFLPKWNLKLLSIWYWIKISKYGDTVCPFNLPLQKQPFEQLFIACHEASNAEHLNELIEPRYLFSVPSAIHSQKPPLFDLLEKYLEKKPKCLELFARYLLSGFTSIGLEVLKLQNIKLYTEID